MERDQRTRSDVPPVPPASGASRSASTAAAPEPNGREARTYPSLSFRQSSQRSQKSLVLSMKLASAVQRARFKVQARRSGTGPGRWVDLASLKASRSRMYALGRAGRSRSRHFYDKNLSKTKFSLHTGTVLYRYCRSLPVRGPLPLVMRPPSDLGLSRRAASVAVLPCCAWLPRASLVALPPCGLAASAPRAMPRRKNVTQLPRPRREWHFASLAWHAPMRRHLCWNNIGSFLCGRWRPMHQIGKLIMITVSSFTSRAIAARSPPAYRQYCSPSSGDGRAPCWARL